MDCYCYLPIIQDLWSDGKIPSERRSGEPFKGPVIPCGAMVEYHHTRPVQAPPSWQESFTWNIQWICFKRGGIWKGKILIADIEELKKMNAPEIYPQRIHAKQVLIPEKGRIVHIPSSRWYSETVRKRLQFPKTHSMAWTNRKERRSQWRTSRRTGRVSTDRIQRWLWSPEFCRSSNEWWADSTECCCYLRNIQDLLSHGKTPYERRFGIPFNGPVIPFGAMVEYHPISAKDISRHHQFGPKSLASYSSVCIVRGENLERRHYGRRHWRIGGDGHIRKSMPERLNAKEVSEPIKSENFIFPVADGTVKISGGSGSENIHLNSGIVQKEERNKKFFEENQTDSLFSNPTSRWLNTGWCGSQKLSPV